MLSMFNQLKYGEFFYASVERHFGQNISKTENSEDKVLLEARLHICTFGMLSNYVQPTNKPKKDIHDTDNGPKLDWSKVSFNDSN